MHRGARKWAGRVKVGERKREGGKRQVREAAHAGKLPVCLHSVYSCAPALLCACMHERTDSNVYSQMKSSNVSARKPQLGSHGS